MNANPNHIFIDTNVFIGAIVGLEQDIKCLKYIYSLKGKRIYTSSLAIAQIVAKFQKKYTREMLVAEIKRITTKCNIISFSASDIDSAMKIEQQDMEDNIQYIISSKLKCFHFVTNNIKDYKDFNNINAIKPSKIRNIFDY